MIMKLRHTLSILQFQLSSTILLFRQDCGHSEEELTIDKHVIAIASDVPLTVDVPLLDINDIPQITAFIMRWLGR